MYNWFRVNCMELSPTATHATLLYKHNNKTRGKTDTKIASCVTI